MKSKKRRLFMPELSIKNYYDRKLMNKKVDVRDKVMCNIIKNRKQIKLFSKKLVVLVAISAIFILGCGYALKITFLDPNGNVFWGKVFDDESYGYSKTASEIYNELDLEEGELVHILVKEDNPDEVIITSQKPWTVYNYDNVYTSIVENFDCKVEEICAGYRFNYAEWQNVFSLETDNETMAYLRENIGDDNYIYKIEEGTLENVSHVNLFYGNEGSGFEINIFKWIGNEVHYTYENYTSKEEVINIMGFEGIITTENGISEFQILKDEVYITITYEESLFDGEMISEIAGEIINLDSN